MKRERLEIASMIETQSPQLIPSILNSNKSIVEKIVSKRLWQIARGKRLIEAKAFKKTWGKKNHKKLTP
jgi:hypothetical protein